MILEWVNFEKLKIFGLKICPERPRGSIQT